MTEPNAALVGRDELRETVADGLMDAIGLDVWESDDTFRLHAENLYPAVDKVIALIQAARDAEIREALLSDGAISVMTDGVDRLRDEYRDDLLAVFNYIGLHGDGTGGQG